MSLLSTVRLNDFLKRIIDQWVLHLWHLNLVQESLEAANKVKNSNNDKWYRDHIVLFKHSYNRMLDNSVTSHYVAEQCDVERLELATDNSLSSQETFVEGRWVCFWRLVEIFILHACTVSKSYNRNANIIVELMCGIQCRTIEATKVRCRYALVNT